MYIQTKKQTEVKKHMDIKIKIDRAQETQYRSMYRMLEEFICIQEAMSVKQGHPYPPFELLSQQTKSLSHPDGHG